MKTCLKRVSSIAVIAAMCLSLSLSVCATPNITTKEIETYNEYVDIAENIAKTYSMDIEVVPIEEFDFQNVPTITDYEETLLGLANINIGNATVRENNSNIVTNNNVSPNSVPYYKTKTITGKSVGVHQTNIIVSGVFYTYYNDGYGRQIFTGSSYLNTPTFSNSALEWDDSPTIDSTITDAGRTFYSYIQGDVRYGQNTVIRNYDFYVFFYCDEEGKVT